MTEDGTAFESLLKRLVECFSLCAIAARCAGSITSGWLQTIPTTSPSKGIAPEKLIIETTCCWAVESEEKVDGSNEFESSPTTS
jgi:hypothetical protein